MTAGTFDKLAWVAIILSFTYTAIAATSWNWFPTPGDWGDIARIPKKLHNYIALLLPPTAILLSLVIKRRYFTKEDQKHQRHQTEDG